MTTIEPNRTVNTGIRTMKYTSNLFSSRSQPTKCKFPSAWHPPLLSGAKKFEAFKSVHRMVGYRRIRVPCSTALIHAKSTRTRKPVPDCAKDNENPYEAMTYWKLNNVT